jgi:hypothetical protein
MMRVEFSLLHLLVMGLAGCAGVELDENALMTEAKTAIAAELADPATAQFRLVRIPAKEEARINGVVCGEILGQFEGGPQGVYRTFIYSKRAEFAGIDELWADDVEVSPEARDYKRHYDVLWRSTCAKR